MDLGMGGTETKVSGVTLEEALSKETSPMKRFRLISQDMFECFDTRGEEGYDHLAFNVKLHETREAMEKAFYEYRG